MIQELKMLNKTEPDSPGEDDKEIRSEHVPKRRNQSSWWSGDSTREVTGVYDDKKRIVGGLCGQDSRQLWCKCHLSWSEGLTFATVIRFLTGLETNYHLSVLTTHEQVRNQVNARWSFWVRVYFQIFSIVSDWPPLWSRRISSFETSNVNLCLWCAKNSVMNFLVVIPMKQSDHSEWARISKKFKGWRFAPTKDDGASYNSWDK